MEPSLTGRPKFCPKYCKCEWQRLSPRPGDEDACEPLTLIGTNGPDRLRGADGDDVLRGRGGNDVIRGGGGNDELYGGPGNDVLLGGKGDDELRGRDGNDVIRGGDGNDELYGGPGDDVLRGGKGDDTYTGGHNADRFVFTSSGKGDKIITDFEPCDGDRIVLSSAGTDRWPTVADILASEVQEPGGYTVYTLRRGLTVETDVILEAADFVSVTE